MSKSSISAMDFEYNNRQVILSFNIKRDKTTNFYKNNKLDQLEFFFI